MEAAILTTQRLDHRLRADLEVRSGDQLIARVGDVVLFRVWNRVPFQTWKLPGGKGHLVPGRIYIGVFASGIRQSISPLVSVRSAVPTQVSLAMGSTIRRHRLLYGHSPTLYAQTGYGRPADVEVTGILYDSSRQTYLNTISNSGLNQVILNDRLTYRHIVSSWNDYRRR